MNRLSEIKKSVIIFFLILVFFTVTDIGCVFRFFTGIPCPSCGLTRAYYAAMRLDFAAAFYFHPLFPMFLPCVIYMVYAKQPYFNSRKLHAIFVAFFSFLVFGVWILRIFFLKNPDIKIDIHDGFVLKLIKNVLSIR